MRGHYRKDAYCLTAMKNVRKTPIITKAKVVDSKVLPFQINVKPKNKPKAIMNIIVALSTKSRFGLNICIVVCIGFRPVNSD
ncbi:MAG: hypothetical protein CL833_01135 [Crocinitomicaceae bacterium]|nr:hypothetical protein [Crocinitomicaceae bacterium]